MKTYSFIVAVRNSTIVEVQAENLLDAHDIVMNKVHEGGYLTDLCNPSDMEIEVDIDGEEECYKSAHTFMMGKREDASELCRELNAILGRNEFVVSSDGAGVLGISAEELTDEEIERLNLSEDFIIN
jgi:hypothetical protein